VIQVYLYDELKTMSKDFSMDDMDEDGNLNFDGWQMKDKLRITRNNALQKSYFLFPFWFGFVVLQVSSFDVCFSIVQHR
jgi:hypothetical protein